MVMSNKSSLSALLLLVCFFHCHQAQDTAKPMTLTPVTLTPTSIACSTRLNIVFVLDGSSSITYKSWVKLIDIVHQVLTVLPIGPNDIHVGIVVFSSVITYSSTQLSFDKQSVLNEVNMLQFPDGGTITNLGITSATNLLGNSSSSYNTMVIMTDGATETQAETAASVAKAREKNIILVAVGFGPIIKVSDLALLADPNRVINTGNLSNLYEVLINITRQACEEAKPTTLVPVTPTSIACSTRLNIVFVLDGSSSITYKSWVKLIDIVHQVLTVLPIGPNDIHVGIVVFSSVITYSSTQLSFDKQSVLNEVNMLQFPDGGTITNLGITSATNLLGNSSSGYNTMVIMTDGATETQAETAASIAKAREKNIIMVAVGFGPIIKVSDLVLLADPNRVINTGNLSNLYDVLINITRQACEEAKPTTLVPVTPTSIACSTRLNIVFVLDGSSSITYKSWVKLIDIVHQVLTVLPIGPNDIHVGIVVFSSIITYSSTQLSFDKQSVLNEVNMLQFPDGGTITNLGITSATNLLGNSSSGYNTMVIMTDGATETQAETAASVAKAREKNIIMVAVGFGPIIKVSDLVLLADPNRVINTGNLSNLYEVLINITRQACEEAKPTTLVPVSSAPRSIACSTRLNIVLVLDGSNSITYKNWVKLIDIVHQVLTVLPIGPNDIRVGIVVFSSVVTYSSTQLSFDKQSVLNEVNMLVYPDGSTKTSHGINAAVNLLVDSISSLNAIVIVTDGATDTKMETMASIAEAREKNIIMVAVGFGPYIKLSDLELLGDPNRVINAGNITNLYEALVNIILQACNAGFF